MTASEYEMITLYRQRRDRNITQIKYRTNSSRSSLRLLAAAAAARTGNLLLAVSNKLENDSRRLHPAYTTE